MSVGSFDARRADRTSSGKSCVIDRDDSRVGGAPRDRFARECAVHVELVVSLDDETYAACAHGKRQPAFFRGSRIRATQRRHEWNRGDCRLDLEATHATLEA